MDKKNLIIVSVILVIAGGGVWYALKKYHSVQKTEGGCMVKIETRKQNDPYMRGLIEQDQEFEAQLGYYECNSPKKGDYVLFRMSEMVEPFVRIVAAVPDDEFELVKNKTQKAWNIKINGDLYMNGEQPYFFGTINSGTTLGLYTKNKEKTEGTLKDGEMIIFSAFPPGDKDSGIIGLTNVKDMIGKVTVKKK